MAIAGTTILETYDVSLVTEAHFNLKLEHPYILSMTAQCSNELQWPDPQIGLKDTSLSNDHHISH